MADIDVGAISEALNNKADLNLNNTNPLARTVVEVSDKSLMPSWYRIYSDGWCEQGGQYAISSTNGQGTVNLMKTYKDTKYDLLFNKSSTDASSWNVMYKGGSMTTSSFVLQANLTGYTLYGSWRTNGYLA